MLPTRIPRVKICCIADLDEAMLAVEAGASALGLVSQMPSGPGVISEEAICRIAMHVPPGVATFLLTCLQSADDIITQQRRCRTSVLQLCDMVEDGAYAKLRDAIPGIAIVQVIHVVNEQSITQALQVVKHVDALLLDSGRPDLAVKELGGTGRVHDWTFSAEIRSRATVPAYLAGGLNGSNVERAVRSVAPFGLDLCSGVRTDGRLDPMKLHALFAALPRAGTD